MKPIFKFGCLLILYSFFVSSCITSKDITYFNDLPDSTRLPLQKIDFPAHTIQVNDALQVTIGGENEKTVQYINQYVGGGNGIEAIVNLNGDIEFPKIGNLHLAGLNRDEAKKIITQAYSVYLQDPIISIKFISFHFSVLGEVRSPGYYSVVNEKLNIFEALALAGDMTQFGRRENVKIIRETNGKREIISLNFNDKNILNSPYYYLNSYDVLYVEPAKIKATSDNFTRNAAFVSTITTFALLIFTIFRK